MLLELFAVSIFVAAILAWNNWRRGVLLLIVIGTLQDPIRKLTPEAPAILAIASLPVWLAMVVGAYRSDPGLWRRFARAHPQPARAMGLFVLCLIPPVLLVMSYGIAAWRMALLGSFAYVAPLATVVLGFSTLRQPAGLRRLLLFHAAYTTILLAGAWLEFLGVFPASPILGTSALGFTWVRTRYGAEALSLIAGVYRSPDLMAWHAAMLVMEATTLATTSVRRTDRLWLLAAVWGGACLLMAGRRKAIIMPVVFVASLLLYSFIQRRVGRAAALVAVGGGVAASILFAAGEVSLDRGYIEYAASTATEGSARLTEGTVGALRATFLQSGILGRGLGSATQGAQHLAGSGLEQGWQESGAAKLLAELGIPGFACALWLGFLLARGALRAAATASSRRHAPILGALLGILAANAASFTVSHQIYGDIVVVTMTALLLGAALSAPRWFATESVRVPSRAGVRPLALSPSAS